MEGLDWNQIIIAAVTTALTVTPILIKIFLVTPWGRQHKDALRVVSEAAQELMDSGVIPEDEFKAAVRAKRSGRGRLVKNALHKTVNEINGR